MDRRERLEELLAEAHERQSSGSPFDSEAFLRENPEFSDELRAHLKVLPLADRAMAGSATQTERNRVRGAFLELYNADRHKGAIRPIHAYKNLFPGFWDVVAEEYARVADPESATRREDRAPAPAATPSTRSSAASSGAFETIGAYRIIREVGRGGMGVVYLAEDTRLKRHVAMKVLSPVFASSKDLHRRFEREAAAASRLDHPGICTVFEAGEADGIPFIAMRFVHGETLEHWINLARSAAGLKAGPTPTLATIPRPADATPLPALPQGSGGKSPTGSGAREEILRLVHLIEKASRALHVAHEAGLIHRDIKPGNIMVTREGEPVVLDFGLARDEDGTGHSITQTGALMGTPAYMSPEQITAQRIKLDRRTDVYSMGVTLYEALTLRLPFAASSRDSLYQKILVSDPENPRRLNPALPADLKIVLEKTLEKDRERRYPTALELAEDLRRIREFEPVTARPVSRITRLQRWAQRNPGVAAPIVGIFGLAVVAPPAVLYLMEKARQGVREEAGQGAGAASDSSAIGATPELTVANSLLLEAKKNKKLRNFGLARSFLSQALQAVPKGPEGDALRSEVTSLLEEIGDK